MLPELLSTEKITDRYKMASTEEAAKWMHNKLPCIKIGKRLFVRADDVAEWERKNTIYPVIRVAKRRRTL